jgi:hypothetical protein
MRENLFSNYIKTSSLSLFTYIEKFEFTGYNCVLNLFVDYIVLFGCLRAYTLDLVDFVIDQALNKIHFHLSHLLYSHLFCMKDFICFFSSVEKDGFQHKYEMPHVRATHLTVELFYQNVYCHDWIQYIDELCEKEIEGETNVGNRDDFPQKIFTIKFIIITFLTFAFEISLLEMAYLERCYLE